MTPQSHQHSAGRGAARFHPGTDAFTHEIIGKALLEIDPHGPRW
jgi:hypothetical protein